MSLAPRPVAHDQHVALAAASLDDGGLRRVDFPAEALDADVNDVRHRVVETNPTVLRDFRAPDDTFRRRRARNSSRPVLARGQDDPPPAR